MTDRMLLLSLPAVPIAAPPSDVDAALRGLVERHHAFVWRTLRRLGVRECDVDDAVQKVYLVASRKLDAIAPNMERAFLFGVASRVASNERRARRRALEDAAPTPLERAMATTPGPHEVREERRARAVLDDLLDGLPHDRRTVFVLFELEGMGTAAIAEMTGWPAGTVASRLRRARELFQGELKRWRARMGAGGGRP